MIWKGSDRRTVFLLGAGATRGAIGHIVLNRKRLKPPLNSDFFSVTRTFIRAQPRNSQLKARYAKLVEVLRREFRLKANPTMEDAFSLLYVSKDFPEIYGPGRGRRRRAGSRREIEDFLRITFGVLTALDRTSDSSTLYDDLTRSLGPNDSIITLNYDTALDSALVRAGWDPGTGYGLIGGRRKVRWSALAHRLTSRLAKVRLLKLHGSLNWYVKGTYSRLSRVFDARPSRVTRPRRNESAGYMRQIVPPIYGKFFGHRHWGRLWSEAFRALCEADILVVVGCSLVDTDFHLRALIQRTAAVRTKLQRAVRCGIFVDRVRVRRRWRRALKGAVGRTEGYRTFGAFAERYLRSHRNGNEN